MNDSRPILFVVYRPSWQTVLFWLALFAAGIALFCRAPGHITAPELWAEDGRIWILEAYKAGWRSLLWPRVGYLQTISRLAAMIGLMLPFTAIPLFFALVAFALQLAPATLLLSPRAAALIPSFPARLLLAAFYIAEPNAGELYVNLTNGMWHLALLAFLLVVLPKPQTKAGFALELFILLLAGLSGPLVLFLAPIALWHVYEHRAAPGRRGRALYAAVLTLCALLQGWLVATLGPTHRVVLVPLGATLNRFVHILADQIFVGGILGALRVAMFDREAWWQSFGPSALCCLLAFALCAAAVRRGPGVYRQFLFFAVLIMATALKSPVVSNVFPQWDLMQYPGAGDRYYVIPILAWFATLLVLATPAPPALPRYRLLNAVVPWLARFLLCASAIGVATDFTYLPYIPTGYHDAAKTFDQAPPGATVTFPENPPPWNFTLTKR